MPKTRRQIVEDHFDDCGTDLNGLASYLFGVPELGDVYSAGDYGDVYSAGGYDDEDLLGNFTSSLPIWWFRGSSAPGVTIITVAQTTRYDSIHQLLTYLTSSTTAWTSWRYAVVRRGPAV